MIITGDDVPEKRADESWKEKAKREKEKLADDANARAQEALDRQLPSASFLGLVEDFTMRAMFALGQIREPGTQEVYLDLEGAKYVIDLLDVLEQKTKGNLDANEAQALHTVLHNLRLTFVQVSRMAASAVAAEMERNPAASGKPGAKPDAPAAGPGPQKPGPKIIY